MKKQQLQFKFDLTSKVSIYVPTTVDVKNPVDNHAQVLSIIGKLSDMFGGATASDAVGGWRCSDGSVVVEKVTIVYAFCKDEELVSHIDDILSICGRLKEEMRQEAISLEINGQLAFI